MSFPRRFEPRRTAADHRHVEAPYRIRFSRLPP